MPSFAPGIPISEGDILFPPFGLPTPGPVPIPSQVILPGPNGIGMLNLGLFTYAFGAAIPPGVPGLVEVDALSYGTDALVTPVMPSGIVWTFSVDEHAVGFPSPGPPNVMSEGAFGAMDASGDVYMTFPPGVMPPGPLPPFGGPPSATLLFDGDGVPAPFAPVLPPIPGLLGLGLVEPNPPTPFLLPDPGMNLDALDVDSMPGAGVYFSLDSLFADPIEGPGVNSGSALANGFVGGDVLFTPLAVGLAGVYAPAGLLGLDLIGGPDTDDLDALVLLENGVPGYQPSMVPYDWVGGLTDMLLFSVRRGSIVIGAPDSMFGIPICEGDILTTPLVGGASPFPAIFIAAENLGLATMRSMPGGVFLPPWSDELDALDVSADCDINGMPDFYDIAFGLAADCNVNGQIDFCDIASGIETDCNCNGVPDTCDIAAGVMADTDGDGIPNECECPADFTGPLGVANNTVGVPELLAVINAWGGCPAAGCPADIAPPPCGDGVVGVADLLAVINGWGACP